MVRLPPDSPFRLLTAGQLLSQARELVGDASVVRNIQIVKSGIALIPPNESARSKILSCSASLNSHFSASAVEAQSDAARDTFLIPWAPLSGSLELYSAELFFMLSAHPLSVRMVPNNTEDTGTLFVQFPAGKISPRKVTLFHHTFSLSLRLRKCTSVLTASALTLPMLPIALFALLANTHEYHTAMETEPTGPATSSAPPPVAETGAGSPTK
ncbi:hypothetical protein KEM55_007531, partial [Ascosphaera atra]